jgi:hypothetical protein
MEKETEKEMKKEMEKEMKKEMEMEMETEMEKKMEKELCVGHIYQNPRRAVAQSAGPERLKASHWSLSPTITITLTPFHHHHHHPLPGQGREVEGRPLEPLTHGEQHTSSGPAAGGGAVDVVPPRYR